MKDKEIRNLLISTLNSRLKETTFSVFEEVPVGSGSARADIVIASDELECFEIKSEVDTLSRLSSQGWQYGKAFGRVNLVAASKHIDKALTLIPAWWGVWEITTSGKLLLKRKAKKNPQLDSFGLSELLTQNERKMLLRDVAKIKGFSKLGAKEQHMKVAEIFSVQQLSDFVINFLNSRNACIA